MTIALIIDDNGNNVTILAEMLLAEGVQFTALHNPLSLAQFLEGDPHLDIIFLDLEMPGLNGYAVFDKIKANGQYANIPVVAYTVHVSEIKTARQLGFHSFLGKPIDMDSFPDQLARILRGEHVWSTQ